MSKVFTVFFCGTAANHRLVVGDPSCGNADGTDGYGDYYPEGEIVARLWAQQPGKEFVDKIIVDGPGSKGLQLNGAYFMDPGGARDRGHSDAHGGITGVGWEENIQHALGVIIGKSFRTESSSQDLLHRSHFSARPSGRWSGAENAATPFFEPGAGESAAYVATRISTRFYGEWTTEQRTQLMKVINRERSINPITTLNIVGWSRGGVSAIMLANLISETKKSKANNPDYKALKSLEKINIIAYDPVPGMNNFQTCRTTLPAIVKNYVAFYARDDRSYGFAPVVPRPLDRSTRIVMLTLPGKHTSLVGKTLNKKGKQAFHLPILDTAVDAALKAPYDLARILSEEYLYSWGIPLMINRANNNDQVLLNLYRTMTDESSIAQYKRERSISLLDAKFMNVRVRQYVNGKNPGTFNTRYENLYICKHDNYPHTGDEVGAFPTNLPKQLKLVKHFINWHHQLLSGVSSASGSTVTLPETFGDFHYLID